MSALILGARLVVDASRKGGTAARPPARKTRHSDTGRSGILHRTPGTTTATEVRPQ